METLKDPAFMLSGINSAALLGFVAYFYNHIAEIKKDMAEIAGVIQKLRTDMLENKKITATHESAFKGMGEKFKSLESTVNSLPDEIEVLTNDLDSMIEFFNENGHEDLERESTKPKKRSKKTRKPREKKKTINTDIEEFKDTPLRKGGKAPVRHSRKDESESEEETDEDADLINAVRK